MKTITEPGLYYDVPAAEYHADPCPVPSLSSSLARVLLEKGPAHAWLEHSRLGGHQRERTESMDTGTIVHAILASSEGEFEVGEFDDFRTKAASEWRKGVEASGRVAVTRAKFEQAQAIAAAVFERAALGVTDSPFSPAAKHEVTAVWKEGETYCRARYDVLVADEHKNAVIWDWKTTKDTSDRAIEKSLAHFRYDIQAAFYMRGMEANGYKLGQISFIFVFIETTPPYTVRRVVLSQEYLATARQAVSEAIEKWQACQAANAYPVTPPDTLTVEIPHYLSENDGEITID